MWCYVWWYLLLYWILFILCTHFTCFLFLPLFKPAHICLYWDLCYLVQIYLSLNKSYCLLHWHLVCVCVECVCWGLVRRTEMNIISIEHSEFFKIWLVSWLYTPLHPDCEGCSVYSAVSFSFMLISSSRTYSLSMTFQTGNRWNEFPLVFWDME